jgi:DNA-binding NarL/FixJ family response regulator
MAILIADDEQQYRKWLKMLILENLPDHGQITEVEDGQDAVAEALKLKPAIVFLDIKMPKLSGIKAAEQILAEAPDTGIIMLSNFQDEVYVRQLWKIVPPNGAFAYVLKNASNEQVMEAAKAVLSGDCWIHPGIARVIQRTQNKATNLTSAEYEALICIAVGLTDHAIAKRLYLTEKAIQSRLKSLYAKLRVPGRSETQEAEYNQRCRAVFIALQRGLVNQPELLEWETKILGGKGDILETSINASKG